MPADRKLPRAAPDPERMVANDKVAVQTSARAANPVILKWVIVKFLMLATAESSTVFQLHPSLFPPNLYTPISFFRYAFLPWHKRIAATATNYGSARGINPLGSEDSCYTHCALARKLVV